MVKIRLKRIGRKKLPIYKVVVTDERAKRDGRAIDILGTYKPKSKEIQIDVEKVNEWLKKGAQPTSPEENKRPECVLCGTALLLSFIFYCVYVFIDKVFGVLF